MKLQKTVIVGKPLDAVFGYLSDFTTTTEWDPGTVLTVIQHGDGGVGTTYLNTSTFLGRETQLTYVVREFVPGERIRLRGENKTVTAVDTMTFRSVDAWRADPDHPGPRGRQAPQHPRHQQRREAGRHRLAHAHAAWAAAHPTAHAAPKPWVRYDAIVDEALAHGWVDSRPRSIDEHRFARLLTPRKPTSNWSARNKARVEQLTAAGRMHAAGLAAVAAAQANGAWTALDETETLAEPADLAAALEAAPGAREYWDAFPRSARRAIPEWITNAKTATTRQARIQRTAADAARNIRANQWRQPTGRRHPPIPPPAIHRNPQADTFSNQTKARSRLTSKGPIIPAPRPACDPPLHALAPAAPLSSHGRGIRRYMPELAVRPAGERPASWAAGRCAVHGRGDEVVRAAAEAGPIRSGIRRLAGMARSALDRILGTGGGG